MKRAVLSTLAVAAAMVSVAINPNITDDVYDVSWKPVVGQAKTYKIVTSMVMDFGQRMDIVVNLTSASKVTKVEDGKVTTEGTVKEFKLTMDGQDAGDMAGESPEGKTSTTVHTLDGMLVSMSDQPEQSGGLRVQRMSAFLYPKAKVKVGEDWTKEFPAVAAENCPAGKAKFTLEALENKDGVDCFKIKYAYSEMEGDAPFGAIGTVWIDQKDGTPVRAEAEYQNVKFVEMMPPTNAKFVMTLIK